MLLNQDKRELRASMTEAALDSYETTLQLTADIQLRVADAFRLEPIRSYVAACANATRDVGATQLSTARWFLDV
jgi:hypothetical protein